MLRITSKKEGFRRCGIAHPMAAVEYNDDQFTQEQLACLQAEPMLVVEEIGKETKKKSGKSAPDNS